MSQEYLDVYVEMKLVGLFYADGIAIIGCLEQQHDRCRNTCRDRYNGVVHCPAMQLPFILLCGACKEIHVTTLPTSGASHVLTCC